MRGDEVMFGLSFQLSDVNNFPFNGLFSAMCFAFVFCVDLSFRWLPV